MGDPLLDLVRELRADAGDALREARGGAACAPAAKAVLRNLKAMAESWPARERWACRQGCSFCCHNAVSVSAPEAFRLVGHLRGLPDAQRAPLLARLAERTRAVAGLTMEQQAERRAPCGLLQEDGSCGGYAARPIPCHAMVSMDRSACERVFSDPASGAKIPLDGAWFTVAGAHNLALRLATRDAGLAPRRYELHDALATCLTQPDAERRWLAGEDVFAACRVDRTSDGPDAARDLDRLDPASRPT